MIYKKSMRVDLGKIRGVHLLQNAHHADAKIMKAINHPRHHHKHILGY